ncbi:MAG TPA: hypothetical protein VNG69_01775 [Casimicrobiaceae bacterium]|nr:hypothetical protein [Casimicrobiaceae bacterium]
MIDNTLLRRSLTAAMIAAAGAAGAFAMRHFLDKRDAQRKGGYKRKEDKIDVSRWEGEGGSPPDCHAAVPHQPPSVNYAG